MKAGDLLFAAGPPDIFDQDDPFAPFEGRRGGKLVVLSAKDGKKQFEAELKSPPVFDGMIASKGSLFLSCLDGTLVCLGAR